MPTQPKINRRPSRKFATTNITNELADAVNQLGQVGYGEVPESRLFVCIIPVLIEKDGGADGTASTAATWTYKVADLAKNIIKTGVVLARPRPKGKAAYQTGTITGTKSYGIAFYDVDADRTLRLLDAYEIFGTAACP